MDSAEEAPAVARRTRRWERRRRIRKGDRAGGWRRSGGRGTWNSSPASRTNRPDPDPDIS